jgi:hypothetical protein
MVELSVHLRKTGSKLTAARAATEAIRAWIKEREQPRQAAKPAGPSRGFQWKDLFLPEGTELRMSTAGGTHHARVVEDHIVFNGDKVSPRGMTLAIAGDGRNAWRDLWLKFPGDKHYLPASRCRREQARNPSSPMPPVQGMSGYASTAATAAPLAMQAAPPASAAEPLTAATAALTEALEATLALMDRANAQLFPAMERRAKPPRRDIDILADHCAYD